MIRSRNASSRPAPPEGPWLSRKDWRRVMRLAIERGLSSAQRRELMSRLARVRGVPVAPSPPRLRLLEGGSGADGAPSPRRPGSRKAA